VTGAGVSYRALALARGGWREIVRLRLREGNQAPRAGRGVRLRDSLLPTSDWFELPGIGRRGVVRWLHRARHSADLPPPAEARSVPVVASGLARYGVARHPGHGVHGAHVKNRAIPAAEFKDACLKLMDEVSKHGMPITVTKRGRPLVRVVPVRPAEGPRTLLGTILHEDEDIFSTGALWDADRRIRDYAHVATLW
jgi:prevent-host-death family protein